MLKPIILVPSRSAAHGTHDFHARTGTIGPRGTFGSDCVLPLQNVAAASDECDTEETFANALYVLAGRMAEHTSPEFMAEVLLPLQALVTTWSYGEDDHADEIADALAGHPS